MNTCTSMQLFCIYYTIFAKIFQSPVPPHPSKSHDKTKLPLHPIHIVTGASLMGTASQHTPFLSSFNLSRSIFIRLKIRIDVHIALSYRYLLHIKDRTGRSPWSILHQFVV